MEWRPIKGFNNTYEVNNHGHVRRIGAFEFRKPELTKKGYHKVILYDRFNTGGYYVHRLVAGAFIPNPENKPYINHKDGHKLHNWIENLEWCTTEENNAHARKNGLYKPLVGSKHGMASLTEEKVLKARKEYAQGKPFVWIARELKVDPATIRRAIIRETWKHI